MSLLGTVGGAVLPVVAVAAVGYLLGRFRDVDPDPLNAVTVYVLAPALVFHTMATTTLAGATLVGIVLGAAALTLTMAFVAEGLGRLRGATEPMLGAFVLVTAFPNVGNFGIPLAEFAFGQTGRSVAVVMTVAQGVLLYTVGIYVAARGEGDDVVANLRRVFELPLIYAVGAALALRRLGLVPPAGSTAMATVEMVGLASIPVMLLVLGLQLTGVSVEGTLGPVGVASGLKLLVAPVVGLAVALVVGFRDPVVARTFVLLTAGPAAVTGIILVGAFGDRDDEQAEEFVSATVLVTTVGSLVTVTALVALLETGMLV